MSLLATFSFASDDVSNYLLNGKNSLDKGDYESAISQLTTAYEKLPVLGDYALLWRARAYEDRGDMDRAIADLRTVKERFKDSPLIKNVRIKEIELAKKKNDRNLIKLLEGFVKDYPSELNMKYAYASLLKKNGETEKAKRIFKDIYVSVSPLSKSALHELSPSDITTEDLIKRGENLNKAWMFGEAEKCLREALKKESGEGLKTQILEKLAYSIFRQKRYREASELYKEVNNRYWRARSVFRAGDMETFESELQELINTGDKRVVSVLIAYGSKQRRDNNIERALEIFNNTLSKYPSEKEEILWAKGWTYYMWGDCKNASEIFSHLNQTYGGSKYMYWKNKCAEKTGGDALKASLHKKNIPHRDYYGFLSLLKNNSEAKELNERINARGALPSTRHVSRASERVDILIRLGLNNEAVSELTHLAKKNPDHDRLIYISSQLKNLGNYKMSVNLVTKVQYSEDIHDLFYPMAFQQEVEEASRRNGIDPLLIISVMREESRFDADARSIAGALGLMQLMPSTAHKFDKHVKIALKNASQLHDAKTNILIGSYYLKHLVKTFNSIPLAIAAYNAGEEAVREWLKKGSYTTVDEFIEDIPYDETRNYVKRVLTTYFEYMRASRDTDIYAAKKYIGNL
ncbi:lytic transglycosylase domain-containing protein [Dissulfurispira sp.]|uniref:lytic transglycosylase domain-containing protein n=1 Tax=Dissulfurispira sp. TaxID=2817609 RepID=UPI002FD9A0FB